MKKVYLQLLLFGGKIYNEQEVNVEILNASIDCIICSNRFTGSFI